MFYILSWTSDRVSLRGLLPSFSNSYWAPTMVNLLNSENMLTIQERVCRYHLSEGWCVCFLCNGPALLTCFYDRIERAYRYALFHGDARRRSTKRYSDYTCSDFGLAGEGRKTGLWISFIYPTHALNTFLTLHRQWHLSKKCSCFPSIRSLIMIC